jgi:predicted amidohydrolase
MATILLRPRCETLANLARKTGSERSSAANTPRVTTQLAVAALQLSAHDRADFAAVWPGIVRRVDDAAAAGARLIVLPEATIPAYVVGVETLDVRQIERAVADLQQVARQRAATIVCGSAYVVDGVAYNSAIAIDADGSLAGSADKFFLWHFDRRWFAPGERIAPIRTSVGTLGVLVCADGRMPGIASALVDAGAQLLVMPTAWVTSGRDPHALENVQADLLARIRAWENEVPFVAANKCGVERGCVAYCGKSQVVAADGSVTALASQRDPETLTATVTLENARCKTDAGRAALARAPACETARAVRVAITARPDDEELRAAMALLETTASIAADGISGFENAVAVARVRDDVALDPNGLAAYRNAGYRAAVWDVGACNARWIEPLARARALELRMFVTAVDASRGRAFAVDPDGSIVAGTFDGYRVASFALDPQRAEQTLVAPGTDVAIGLRRVADAVGTGTVR